MSLGTISAVSLIHNVTTRPVVPTGHVRFVDHQLDGVAAGGLLLDALHHSKSLDASTAARRRRFRIFTATADKPLRPRL